MRRPWVLLLLLQPCAAPLVCDYQAEISSFSYLAPMEIERGTVMYEVEMNSININFGTSGVSSIDSAHNLPPVQF